MGHGGKREGSGRPVGARSQNTIHAEEMRKQLNERVLLEAKSLLSELFNSAHGKYSVFGRNAGERWRILKDIETADEMTGRIYTQPPNFKTIKYLIDQAIGRAATSAEVHVDHTLEYIHKEILSV